MKKYIIPILIVPVAGILFGLKASEKKPAPQAKRPPNIVFIIADDLSMKDIQPFGSTQVSTPNLAKLASQGICLDNSLTWCLFVRLQGNHY